ncbi:hypothetical protein AM1_G0155 (plasmid) [Acaryochloris marina MBIC11017]|uniref:Uncharacterized protein n=2 Tax=Acaryochloris marina TaxID=155978 RepID=A8ZQP9_ACAM1|nr:hypothetical protein AM1_G0155 [Acaryochloris marina MBIC11017]
MSRHVLLVFAVFSIFFMKNKKIGIIGLFFIFLSIFIYYKWEEKIYTIKPLTKNILLKSNDSIYFDIETNYDISENRYNVIFKINNSELLEIDCNIIELIKPRLSSIKGKNKSTKNKLISEKFSCKKYNDILILSSNTISFSKNNIYRLSVKNEAGLSEYLSFQLNIQSSNSINTHYLWMDVTFLVILGYTTFVIGVIFCLICIVLFIKQRRTSKS